MTKIFRDESSSVGFFYVESTFSPEPSPSASDFFTSAYQNRGCADLSRGSRRFQRRFSLHRSAAIASAALWIRVDVELGDALAVDVGAAQRMPPLVTPRAVDDELAGLDAPLQARPGFVAAGRFQCRCAQTFDPNALASASERRAVNRAAALAS